MCAIKKDSKIDNPKIKIVQIGSAIGRKYDQEELSVILILANLTH